MLFGYTCSVILFLEAREVKGFRFANSTVHKRGKLVTITIMQMLSKEEIEMATNVHGLRCFIISRVLYHVHFLKHLLWLRFCHFNVYIREI